MQKSRKYSLLGFFMLSFLLIGMGVTCAEKLEKSFSRLDKEQNKSKTELNIASISEATITANGFNLQAALVYVFAFDFYPKSIKIQFVDYIPKIFISYLEKLFRSAISNNAP